MSGGANSGCGETFFKALAQQEPDALIFIDSSIVKAHIRCWIN